MHTPEEVECGVFRADRLSVCPYRRASVPLRLGAWPAGAAMQDRGGSAGVTAPGAFVSKSPATPDSFALQMLNSSRRSPLFNKGATLLRRVCL